MVTYGAAISDPIQLSQLNGTPMYGDPIPDNQVNDQPLSPSQQLSSMAQQQGNLPNQGGSYLENLVSSNSLVPSDTLLKMALSNWNPIQTAKSAAAIAGKPLMVAQPELMAEPGMLSGIINTAGRIGAGTLGTTSQELQNVNSPQDLASSLLHNLAFNSAIEAPALGVRSVGGVAELLNPEKYTEYQANNIKNGFDQTEQKMQDAFAPVNDKYNNYMMTADPKNYFGFNNEEKQYFTPNVKKLFNTFIDEPTFFNATQLRSQLGRDAAKESSNPSGNAAYQALTNARGKVIGNQRSLLSYDPESLKSFDNGQQIASQEYYPYLSSDLLSDISQGNKTNLTGNQLVKDIKNGSSGKDPSIPQNHPLNLIGDQLNDRLNRSKFMQNAVPFGLGTVGGAIAGEMLHPGLGGAITGAGSGMGAGGLFKYYWEPGFISSAQNPWLNDYISNVLQPSYYGATRGASVYNNR